MNNLDQLLATLNKVTYASMATVNEDGSPHNSPLVFLYDQHFEYIYWGSHPESKHSQNILRTGQAFFVAFDAMAGSTGVYIETTGGQIVKQSDLETALRVHNHFRNKIGKDSIDISYYAAEKPQKMWRAKVQNVWINAYERDVDGRLIRDYKIEVEKDLLTNLWE